VHERLKTRPERTPNEHVSPGTPSVALDKQRLIQRLGTVSTEVLETTLETVQAMFAVR